MVKTEIDQAGVGVVVDDVADGLAAVDVATVVREKKVRSPPKKPQRRQPKPPPLRANLTTFINQRVGNTIQFRLPQKTE
jgi:hypothetical protein